MKTIWVAISVLILNLGAQAQNVFVLGSNTTPPPDLNGNVPATYANGAATAYAVPAAAVAPANVTVNVNVVPSSGCNSYGYSGYPANGYYSQYYPQHYPQYYSPNVMYIGGPGTCGPNYYNYYPYQNSSVIYFGGLQAYRHGYNFRHCR